MALSSSLRRRQRPVAAPGASVLVITRNAHRTGGPRRLAAARLPRARGLGIYWIRSVRRVPGVALGLGVRGRRTVRAGVNIIATVTVII